MARETSILVILVDSLVARNYPSHPDSKYWKSILDVSLDHSH
jgi:hypothetical protein